MSDETTNIEEHWPEPYTPDWPALAEPATEDIFGHTAFELLKEAGILATLASSLIPAEPNIRDEAITVALMLKLAKLAKTIVAITPHVGSDRQLPLFRELIESAAVLQYLVEDTGQGERFASYVDDSLVAEREFLKTVRQNIQQRDAVLEIEQSMMRSIQAAALAAGVNDVDSIPGRRHIAWPKAETLVRGLGPNFYLAYRSGSSVIHTQWIDLLRNHLVQMEDGRFTPRFADLPPSPQPLYAGALVLTRSTRTYLAKRQPEALGAFVPRLDDLDERIERVFRAHGQWLDARGDNERIRSSGGLDGA